MALLKKVRVMAAKVETTPGTAESLTNSEGSFNAYNVMAQANITVDERQGQGTFNRLSGVAGARGGTVTFSCDLGWDGTATPPTWATVLLPCCGWVNSSGTFNPTTEAPGSNVKTCTIGVYVNGKRRLLAGCMGTWRIVLDSGKLGFIEFTFTGVWQGEADVSILTPTYPTAAPLRFASSTVTFDSVAKKVANVTFDAGNTVILREDASTAAGYSTALVTDRAPRITANPESVLVATDTPYADWIANTTAEFSVLLDGPSDSTLEIQALSAQYMNVQEGERNGMVTDEAEWMCTKADISGTLTNDRELQLIFTEAT